VTVARGTNADKKKNNRHEYQERRLATGVANSHFFSVVHQVTEKHYALASVLPTNLSWVVESPIKLTPN